MQISDLETRSDEDYKRVPFSEQDLDISCYSFMVKPVKYEHPKYLRNVDFTVTNHNNVQDIHVIKQTTKRHK